MGIEPKDVSSSAEIMNMVVVVGWGEVGGVHGHTRTVVMRCAESKVELGGREVRRNEWGLDGTALERSGFGRNRGFIR